MALAYVANLDLLGLCPTMALALSAPAIALSASLSGALALNAQFTVTPPTVAFYIAALEELLVQLEAGISLGVPDCSFGVSVAAGISLSLSLSAQLEIALGLLAGLELTLGASIGVYAWTYSGVGTGLGAAMTSALATDFPDGSPSSASTQALIFGAVSSTSQTQFAAFLNGLGAGTGLVYTPIASVAGITEVTASAMSQAEAAINAQLAACAQIGLSLTPKIDIPLPTLPALLVQLKVYLATLKAQLSLAPPKISAALTATANLAANLSAQFDLMIALGATLSDPAATAFVYTYSGTGAAMGAALTSALASTWGDGVTSTSGSCFATVLACTSPVSFTVLSTFFGGA